MTPTLKYPADLSLYPFQKETILQTLSFFETNSTHSCYVANSPGLGKSITTIVTANTLGTSHNLIVCPSIMRYVWEKEIYKWARLSVNSIPRVKVITSGDDTDGIDNANWVIVSYDLSWRPEILAALEAEEFDMLIADEAHFCVEEHTIIETPSGQTPIKDIKEGDKVYSILNNEIIQATVLQKIDGDISNEVTINLSDGNVLHCLDWHLILTEDGEWKEACELKVSDKVCCVRENLGCEVQVVGNKKVLLSAMCREGSFRKSGMEAEDAREKSYEQCRLQNTHEHYVKEDRTQTCKTWWKWDGDTCTAGASSKNAASATPERSSCNGIPCEDWYESGERLPNELQNRCSSPAFEDSYRGRWEEPSSERTEIAGLKKRGAVKTSRVVSVQIHERGGNSVPRGRYIDLKLDKGHNYFANGIVVHNCKSKSKRSNTFFKKLWPAAKYHLLLSGTPFTTNIVDCYRPFHYIMPKEVAFSSFPTFVANFSYEKVTPWGNQYFGLKNEDILRRIIRSNFFIRFRKEDVLTELPDVQHTSVMLPVDYAIKMSSSSQGWDKQRIIDSILHDMAPKVSDNLASLRRLQGETKVPAVVEYAEDMLEQEIPIVIFAYHKSVVAAIKEGLSKYRPVTITGETNAKDRQTAIEAFQSGATNCIICNITAGGVGITLTRANNVLMAEAAWTAAENNQAISRCHRIGTKGAVTVHWFIVMESIDEDILNVVMRRTKEFSKIFDSGLDTGNQ